MEWDWGPKWLEHNDDQASGDSQVYDDELSGPSMVLVDHQNNRASWCICGTTLERGTVLRCTWCRRRHRPPKEWGQEWNELGRSLPVFDD
ncbi:hypothetical protein CEP53_000844 [Fusarium sp. AF-6]|nr:hypothetical protein CEP53_000844 [Fusarium sp. AF-6]